MKTLGLAVVAALAAAAASCGEFAREGNSSQVMRVQSITATSGSTGDSGTFLQSDVATVVDDVTTTFNDTASAVIALLPKNPTNPVAPTAINSVTIYRYRVEFKRTDGRNTPGIDVPQPVEGALTATVAAGSGTGAGTATVGFDLIRHTAKQEAPLRALRNSFVLITTIAEVTFFGRDQAGNDLSATGALNVTFGDFGDPD
jgi:hypothetical protein